MITTPSIRFVRYLGPSPRCAGAAWRMVGQDGGQSIPLDNEDALFLFADTLLMPQPGSPSRNGSPRILLRANTAAVAHGHQLREGLAALDYYQDDHGLPREILVATEQEREAKLRFWPQHGVSIGGRVLLFYLGIETIDASSNWGFRNVGAGMATLDPATRQVERIHRDGDWCLWPQWGEDFHFGVHVLRVDDEVFIFSSRREGFEYRARVARVQVDHVHDVSAYRYLGDDATWGPDMQAAADLGPCSSDYSISYNAHLDAYLMLYVDAYDHTIYCRTAPRPEGPYSAPQRLGRVPVLPTSEMVYAAFEHPRFADEDGRKVYVSYSQPHFAQNSLVSIAFA